MPRFGKRRAIHYPPRPRRRRYHYARPRFFRRKHDKRFPFSAGIGLATSVLAPVGHWQSVLTTLQRGDNPAYAAQTFIRSWTGLMLGMDGTGYTGAPQFNAMAALNPFDLSEAPAWKSMLWSHLAMMVVKKFTHQDPLTKIPLLGKYIKFS